MGKTEIQEIIRSFQGELSLSYDDVRRICRNDTLLSEIAEAINEYMEDNDLAILCLGRYDKHTQKIVDLIDKKLDY